MEIAKQAIDGAGRNRARGSRMRGQLRARKILEAAQEILTNEGYHSLTLRKIGKNLGISNGNVTYYFANKELLLKAMITDNLARYEEAFERESMNFPNDPASSIRAYFEFLIEDAQNPKSQRFFYQLWALASHNEEVASQRDRVYRHFLRQVTTYLKTSRPELGKGDILKKSVLLMSLIEGLNVIYGSGDKLKAELSTPGPWIVEQIMGIVES